MNICICTVLEDTYPYWNHIIANFQPSTVYHIDKFPSDLSRKKILVEGRKISSIEEIPGTLVLCSPMGATHYPGTVSLTDFSHPEECTYIFGDDGKAISSEEFGKSTPDYTVYIPFMLEVHAHVAASIVLWSRR
jgi:hypothetical protein